MQIINPATGGVLREVDADDAIGIVAKVRRARAAQRSWAARALAERQHVLRRFRALVAEHREALARTCTEEMGKPIAQARREVEGLDARLEYFIEQVPGVGRTEIVHDDLAEGMTEGITWDPLGVVANVSAWNYPFYVGTSVFVPALLTGNAVLYKPSEYATLSGLGMTELLHAAGVPRDVFIPVVGASAAGQALVAQPVDGVFFTGSYATGVGIAAAVASRMPRLQLELGGKDPVYVCEDAPVATTAAAVADGAFYNTGQSCCAVERIYVHARNWDGFLEAFVAAVRAFVVGDPGDEQTYIGPLARREAQLAVLERQVAEAKARGARALVGGERLARPGFYFAPTVLVDVDHDMRVMREETFGPLVGVMRVRDDEEAISLMNDTDYGLTAAVYTPDRDRAERLLSRLDTGTAYWNCCDRVSPRLPWSGRRHSGLGSTLSQMGITAFLRPRAWHLRAI